MGNHYHSGLGIYILFLVANTYTCLGVGNITIVACSMQEQQALLNFKHSVKDAFGMLSSWVGSDCCRWEKVECNDATGYVQGLYLSGGDEDDYLVGNEVSTSLGELRHLKYLDLSRNDFQGSQIPEFIGSLKQLSYLNLSDSAFSGKIPHHIGNLSILKFIDLSSNRYLLVDDMAWISGLSSLKHLDLSVVDLSGAKNRDKGIHVIPSLVRLSLSSCRLLNDDLRQLLNSSAPLVDIKHLNLSHNSFDGKIPGDFRNMKSLELLDLSYNQFTGPIPSFPRKLKRLYLFNNLLNGLIPKSLGRLRLLQVLDLSVNHLTGPIPTFLGRLASLTNLILHTNHLMGPIPSSLGRLVSLQAFSLSSNLLNETIPVSIGNLSKLQFLEVSNNSLEGVVYEAHFANLSMLKHLDLSSNSKLTFNVSRQWIPPFQLTFLNLRYCKFAEDGFPLWLRNQRKLERLDLSNTTISGPLPSWLQKLHIRFLDISYNKLTGPLIFSLPNAWTKLGLILLLHSNLFNEPIPRSFCRRTDLVILSLGKNRLTGKIPECLGDLENLKTMIFSSNRLSGVIPSSLGRCSKLIWLSLHNNNFVGELPQELGNLEALKILDLGDNELSGNIPEWTGQKLVNLAFLRLHKNNFSGRIPLSLCRNSHLQILDLAHNGLWGSIPHCIGDLYSMVWSNETNSLSQYGDMVQVMKGAAHEYTTTWKLVINMDLSSNKLEGEIPVEITALTGLVGLNLSNNHLSGGIPNKIGNMKSLNSLDFSGNKLTGMIPPSIAALNFLSYLNLSHNKLSGRIPTGNQLQTLIDPSIYAGNKDLCGAPLPNNCSNQEDPTTPPKSNNKRANISTKAWLYGLNIMSGFLTGFWGVIGVLVFKKQWRQKLFMFAETIEDKIYVAVMVRVAKMKRGTEAL